MLFAILVLDKALFWEEVGGGRGALALAGERAEALEYFLYAVTQEVSL